MALVIYFAHKRTRRREIFIEKKTEIFITDDDAIDVFESSSFPLTIFQLLRI